MGLKWTLKMGLRNECDERRDPVRAPPGTHYRTCHTRAPPAGNRDTSRPRRGDDETAEDRAPFQPSATGGTGRDSIQTTLGQHDRRNMRIGGHRLQPSIAIGSERHTRYAGRGPVRRALHAVVALRGALVAREFVCLTLDSQGSEATELSRRAFSVRSRAGRGGSARQSSSSTSTSVRKPPWPKADSPRVPAAPLPVLPSGPALPRRRPRSPPPAPPLLFSSS